jgi:hypothetical protein
LNGTDIIIHPLEYPCYIEKEADLCVDTSPIHNSSLCNGNNATEVIAISGDTLLKYLGIHGKKKNIFLLLSFIIN